MTIERPVGSVPGWISVLLLVCLLTQVGIKASDTNKTLSAEDLPLPARPATLRLVSLGEPITLSRLAMLYLQSFDYHGLNTLPYRKLDYQRLIGWLRSIQEIDPLNGYPLFAAARIYAEVPDPGRQRMMLDFIFAEFQKDPNRRWPWAAHAALVAKHRLNDLPLALKYARAIEHLTTASDVPLWAKHMAIFILEDMDELNAARIMVGGLLATGKINDQAERRFLESRLKALEGGLGKGR